MSNEYPKAMYQGTTKNNEMVIAEGLEHEQQLRESGYKHYSELAKFIQEDKASGSISNKDLIPVEQFDVVAKKLADAEEKLDIALNESVKFYNDVDAMKARIAELEPISTLGSVLKPTDYSELSVKELQNALDEKQIKYLKNDNKAALLALLS